MIRIPVALLAQERPGDLEELVLIGPVGIVAVQTTFPDWRMLPEERTAFFRVAGITSFIDGVSFQHRFRGGTVWIVAVHAGHFPFGQRHVRSLGKFGALLFMAGVTRFVDRFFPEKAGVRDLCHRVVAITASELVPAVRRVRPEDCIAALVTGEAHAVLYLCGRAPFTGESHECPVVFGIGGILDVIGARTMTCLTGPLL